MSLILPRHRPTRARADSCGPHPTFVEGGVHFGSLTSLETTKAELKRLLALYRPTAPKFAAWMETAAPEGLAVCKLAATTNVACARPT